MYTEKLHNFNHAALVLSCLIIRDLWRLDKIHQQITFNQPRVRPRDVCCCSFSFSFFTSHSVIHTTKQSVKHRAGFIASLEGKVQLPSWNHPAEIGSAGQLTDCRDCHIQVASLSWVLGLFGSTNWKQTNKQKPQPTLKPGNSLQLGWGELPQPEVAQRAASPCSWPAGAPAAPHAARRRERAAA